MPRKTLAQIFSLIIVDVVLVNISFILAYYIRFRIFLFPIPQHIPGIERYLGSLIFITIVWLAIFKLFGLYEGKRLSLEDEVATIFIAVTASVILILGMLFLYREFWFSRQVILYAWFIAVLGVISSRLIFNRIERSFYRRGIGIKNALVIGATEMGKTFAQRIADDPGLGYRIIGFLDDEVTETYSGFPIIDKVGAVTEVIKKKKVDEVVIATQEISGEKILDIITECEKEGVEFKIIPGILEIMASRVDIDEIGGIPLVTISKIKLKGFNASLKRVFDIILSTLAIAVLSPIMLIVAILIKLDSSGPVLFEQLRIGRTGKLFKMLKFRSMVKGAEELVPPLGQYYEVEGRIYKIREDTRVTRVGKWLRRFSLDEIPQLFNVLMGDMSIVGPRPQISAEVERYGEYYKRIMIAPGITGLWQVSGRAGLSFEDRMRLDIYYIENWSLWLDFKILLRTIPVVLFGKGAY